MSPKDPDRERLDAEAVEGMADSVERMFERGEASADAEGAEPEGAESETEDTQDEGRRRLSRRVDDAGYPIIEDLDDVAGLSGLELTLVDEAGEPFEPTPHEEEPEDEEDDEETDLRPLGATVGIDLPPDEAEVQLREAVALYLAGSVDERQQLGERIVGLTLCLREAGRLDPTCEAIERLAQGEAEESLGTVYLARRLLSDPLATRLVARLGEAARVEELRDVRLRAAGNLGETMAVALADALVNTGDRAQRKTFIDALRAIGEDAKEIMKELVHDRRWFVVRNALVVLREVGDASAVSEFTTGLHHDDERVRKEAVLAMAHIGDERSVLLSLPLLRDPSPDVRRAAALAVGRLGYRSAVDPLLERLDEEDDDGVRVEILRALGSIGDSSAVKALQKQAQGSRFRRASSDVRVAAYRALAHIGTAAARETVASAKRDRDPAVRFAVEELLSS